MRIDFFEREVRKAQERFNETYGEMVVCNLKLRQASIMSVINLGLLCRKIKAAKARDDIRQFIRVRNTLNNHFRTINERRKNGRDAGDGHQGHPVHGSHEGRVSDHLQEMRQHLQEHLA